MVKIKLPIRDEIQFDKDKLYKSFIDVKNFANLNYMKCYKKVIEGKNLIKNYGFIIFIIIFSFYFISLILFYCKYFSLLINIIKKIIEAKKGILKSKKSAINNNILNNNNRNKKNKANKKSKKGKRIKFGLINNNNYPPKKNRIKNHIKKNIINNNLNQLASSKTKSNTNFRISNNNNNFINNINNITSINQNNISHKKYEALLNYNNRELNSLEYNKAIISDKRTYSQYYISLLRTSHLLIFSFYCDDNDYNSQIIKIFLFFFFFSVLFTINTLFFNDGTIHEIYLRKGEYNFIYQIPQIIYSSLISAIINTVIKYLSLSEKVVLEIKKEKKIEQIYVKEKEVILCLKIKFGLFFIISFIILLCFDFYITCFCGIYVNSQIHLIKDTIISFGLSLIYPFGLCLIPGFFRIPALRAKNKNKEYLYKMSILIQNICS